MNEPLSGAVIRYLFASRYSQGDLQDADIRKRVIAETGATEATLQGVYDLPPHIFFKATQRIAETFRQRNDLRERGTGLTDVMLRGNELAPDAAKSKPKRRDEQPSTPSLLDVASVARKALEVAGQFPEYSGAVLRALELARKGDWAQAGDVLAGAALDRNLPPSVRKGCDQLVSRLQASLQRVVDDQGVHDGLPKIMKELDGEIGRLSKIFTVEAGEALAVLGRAKKSLDAASKRVRDATPSELRDRIADARREGIEAERHVAASRAKPYKGESLLDEVLRRFGEPKYEKSAQQYAKFGPWNYSAWLELSDPNGLLLEFSAGFGNLGAEPDVECGGRSFSIKTEKQSRALRDLIARAVEGNLPGDVAMVDTALERWRDRWRARS